MKRRRFTMRGLPAILAVLSIGAVSGCHPEARQTVDGPLPPIDLSRLRAEEREVIDARFNSVDTIIDDMRLMNDLPLAGVPESVGWAKGPGQVAMGNDPRGTRAPRYWDVSNPRFKSDAWWTVALPWFVVFDGEGNAARNTRVQIRNMAMWWQSRSDKAWRPLGFSRGVSGSNCPKTKFDMCKAAGNVRNESDGSTSLLPEGGNFAFHGWWTLGHVDIRPHDIQAIWVSLQARLVPDDASRPNDIDRARYLIQVGADYYPDRKTRVEHFAPAFFNPGIGLSRSKLVVREWKSFNMATIAVGRQEPGGAAVTETAFRAAPPPIR